MPSRTPYVFNIQHFSTHDGPGIRTTIFFKGCPLRCQWCHNPESQLFEPEIMTQNDGKKELVGKQYTIDELMTDVLKDHMIYDQSGGGVTLSGGEVLAMDRDYILELARRLDEQEVSIGIDTCGVAATRTVEQICEYADFFLYDLKFIDDDLHRKYTGGSNHLVLKNLQVLAANNARIFLRLIMLPGINTSTDMIERTMLWLRTNNIPVEQVDILPYHKYGMDKYAKLGRKAIYFEVPEDDEMQRVKSEIEKFYDNVTIGG
ncbi:glycyl-radical enzyme activating protein [Bifidobacterium simiarum]|uniref:Radical SAM protein n=1 Tax=Bifidobacterium simiarum TaxID=2045441 RepID=A0A2M9HCU1_9BIFI|nr:glycyl-radical enzyme activating protein [Bifidobacterium simiarum]MBT1165932.1 glycyl-radical enzyme activating protein [Bifidobacterium simiarum]PJM74630.1 radical SAM protein [Bifidobacterium simiarum]